MASFSKRDKMTNLILCGNIKCNNTGIIDKKKAPPKFFAPRNKFKNLNNINSMVQYDIFGLDVAWDYNFIMLKERSYDTIGIKLWHIDNLRFRRKKKGRKIKVTKVY